MSDLAERLGRLPQGQRSRLLRQMRGQIAPAGNRTALTRLDHGSRARTSFQQEQMWFVDRLGGGRNRNNIALSIRLRGPLDPTALRESVNSVVRRHQVLHSRLIEVDGLPWQEPIPGYVVGVQETDLSGQDDPERELSELTASDAAAPFDLAAGPPIRARLVRLADDEHVLLWVVHHIVWDPNSTRVFTEELTSGYEAAVAGREHDLPALPVDYADFAAWQREKLDADRSAALAEAWRRIMAGSQATEVMSDFPRTPETRGEGKGLSLTLDGETLGRLSATAEAAGTTVFTTLLAAFNALLRHWTRSEDIVVGTASASRPHPDLEPLIGCFVSMITLRTEVSDDLTFQELLGRTSSTVMDAFAHSELPFEQVVEAVRPPRDPLRHPLFQIEFTSLGRWGAHRVEAGGVEFSVEQKHDGAAKFDMSFLAGENDGLELSLEYNTSLYRYGTATGLLEAFRQVLTQVAEDPEVRIGELSLVEEPGASRHARELSRGGPVDEAAYTTTLDRLFRERAQASPGATAIRSGDTVIDYATLDRWSEAVACELRARGARRDEPVAVCLGRGPSAVAGVLGVLKAGAAYLPIDPAAPPERVNAIVTDASVRLALVEPAAPGPLPAHLETLPVGAPPPTGEVAEVPASSEPGDLAYVLYTSGSSGTPKGVMVEHRSVTHFSRAIAADYEITAGDRVLHFAPLTFDVSVFEIFTTLLAGAELVVADDAERHDPELLTALMRRAEVTVAELPPALMPLLDQRRLPGLRLVSVGGEAFPGRLVAEWTAGDRRFVNGYGPTEATVAVTLMNCVGSYDRNPPIGRPMTGHQAFVLDERLRPVPPGVPGELCVAGPGIARGYLGRPGLTAERFVRNPHADGEATARLYRTGDLVRWLPGGNLDFLGRTDRQLKLRGFRIEPGEVESVLALQPGVERAVVTVVPGSDGERVLVGYAVGTADAETVRRGAAALLPGYMVPVVVMIDALPLTPHGKVNLAALPLPADATDTERTAPRDAIEEKIARDIVAPLLEREHVDVEGDFFALGGSSLQATTVVSRVRGHFGVDIALADFFSLPTVAGLATLVRDTQRDAAAQQDRLLSVFAQIEQMSDEEAAEMLRSLGGEPS
ncbi:non-ribosomal peptide synthetase [Streptosporangium lutulentum]|uniref:Amino acid adenylation domain-containing protein n=1 Tax=Streptosporangium lutulentum TaxID=1461250 RepID=A0ABT9QTE2_9ACTN|nr:amino acid adenylation domain-containing protein [Streptosporangium lutulentum]MDP9850019.1 amino acid adenylation domain-containing protein [Streptosporangium lutulentum]